MTLAPDLVRRFEDALGPGGVIREPEQLRTYECDGLTGHRVVPALVVLPGDDGARSAGGGAALPRRGVPFVARGAGTGLSGGALPVADGVVISLARMTPRSSRSTSTAAASSWSRASTNLDVTRAVAPDGFYYAPDPSSQQVCTIGGNVAENSGGAHCLKYGFTVNHVLAADGRAAGRRARRRSAARARPPGPDLLGALRRLGGHARDRRPRSRCASLRRPEAVRTLLAGFASTDAAGGSGLGHRSRPGSCPPRSR